MIPQGIANSSPFIALGRIGHLDILQRSFEKLTIPTAVALEIGDVPPWVSIVPVVDSTKLLLFPSRIHRGEAEVISLGLEHPGAVLVLDDWYAREFSQREGLRVIGTIGLLLRAKRLNQISLVLPIVRQLADAGFRISKQVTEEIRTLAGE